MVSKKKAILIGVVFHAHLNVLLMPIPGNH